MVDPKRRLKSGKHPRDTLSARRVATVMKPGKYLDGGGLILVVDHRCAKKWVLRTVIKGKRCDIGLGSAALVTLARARKEAIRLRAMARAGGDPLAHRRKERRTVPTFEQATRKVYEAHAASWRNKKHSESWIASMENDAFPTMGVLRVDQVTTADVLKVLTAIWLEKPETARRIKQRIRLVLDWAKAAGYRSGDNPCDGLKTVLAKQTDDPVHHASMPYREISAFTHRLHKCDALPITKLALEFLILCACRTGEVLGMTWDEVDLDNKTWTIPANRMKANREHKVPLSARCVEILTEARRFGYMPFIFGNRGGVQLSNQTMLMVMRRMKLDYVPHGFRASFRTWASEKTNATHAVMEAALAHVEHDATVAAYARSDLFEKRRALMEKWAAHCLAVKADVVALRVAS
ncbi:MAG: tyrosine-type recombinase/integrase [Gammaproteobacteria bacterium]